MLSNEAVAGGPFQIRSKKWDVGVLIGSLALLAVGFGGLFVLQGTKNSGGNPTLFFIVFLGILTFAGFAGPGIVYVLRKRNAWVKSKLPGGTMAWIRSHLYLPVLALVAAYVHATIVPFRRTFVGQGAARPRHPRVDRRRLPSPPDRRAEGRAQRQRRDQQDQQRPAAQLPPTRRGLHRHGAAGARDRRGDGAVPARPARSGGRRSRACGPRSTSTSLAPAARRCRSAASSCGAALHPPLTILLFVVLGYHMYDVLGGSSPFDGENTGFASAQSCAGCHSKTLRASGPSPRCRTRRTRRSTSRSSL